MSLITNHSTTILRNDQEIDVDLTIEWSRDKEFLAFGAMTWWRDSMVCRDKKGREIELTPWERESFAHRYVRDL